MAMDLPPQTAVTPPAYVAPAPGVAPECRILSPEEARVAFARLRKRLPGTAFVGAAPSEVCGLVRVQMQRGSIAYTDATGRYFLLALALDTHRGSPADNSGSVEQALEARSQYPADPPAGITPPAELSRELLQSKAKTFNK